MDKARELSAKIFENETVQPIAEPSEGRMTEIIPQTDKTLKQEHSLLKEPTANPSAPKRDLQPKTQMQATEQETSKIPPKPVMSAEAAAKTANVDYRDKSDRWEERYGEKAQRQEKSISSGM